MFLEIMKRAIHTKKIKICTTINITQRIYLKSKHVQMIVCVRLAVLFALHSVLGFVRMYLGEGLVI